MRAGFLSQQFGSGFGDGRDRFKGPFAEPAGRDLGQWCFRRRKRALCRCIDKHPAIDNKGERDGRCKDKRDAQDTADYLAFVEDRIRYDQPEQEDHKDRGASAANRQQHFFDQVLSPRKAVLHFARWKLLNYRSGCILEIKPA